jgi:two-component system CheB/CheR fusion protein
MPYRTANNSIDGLVLTFVNIDRLRQTEKELHQMSEIFREGADPAIVLDLSNRITQLNDSGELIFGYSREEMLGKPIQSFVAPEQVEKTLSLLNKCRDGETIKDHEWTSQTKTGDEQTLLLSLTLLRAAQDEGDAIAMTAKPSTPGKSPV